MAARTCQIVNHLQVKYTLKSEKVTATGGRSSHTKLTQTSDS